MLPFLFRRLLQGVAVIYVVATLTFVLVHAAPGEPFAGAREQGVPQEQLDALHARFGLDKPLAVQYVAFLSNAIRGDFGISFAYRQPVTDILASALPRTLLLMLPALLLGFAGGMSLGALQASRHRTRFDRLTDGVASVVAAVPDFWLAVALVFVFAIHWHLLPASGITTPATHDILTPLGRALDVLQHMVLPVSTLALLVGAAVTRYQRAALLDVLPDAYVRTARAKGLPPGSVLYRHALRNALLPIVTLFGLAFPALLGGAVFIEAVFSWPGVGLLAVNAVGALDYPMILACAMLGSVMVVAGGILADVLYATADPRLRHA